MGATVSSNVSQQVTNELNQAYNSCPAVSANNYADITNVVFNAPTQCGANSNFGINLNAGVTALCAITNTQQALASILSAQSAAAIAGMNLGFTVSSNQNTTLANLNNSVTNSCSTVSSSNNALISDTKISACNFHFVENANANESCQINNTQAIAAQIQTSQQSSATGGTLFGGWFKWLIIGLIIVAVVVVFIIIIILIKKQNDKKKAAASNSSLQKTAIGLTPEGIVANKVGLTNLVGGEDGLANDYTLIIVIILAIMFVLVFFIPKNSQQITQEDISKLNQKISDAHSLVNQSNEITPSNGTTPLNTTNGMNFDFVNNVDYYSPTNDVNQNLSENNANYYLQPNGLSSNDLPITVPDNIPHIDYNRYTNEDPFDLNDNSLNDNSLNMYYQPLLNHN